MTRAEHVAMVDRCRAGFIGVAAIALLGVARSGVYRHPTAPNPEEPS